MYYFKLISLKGCPYSKSCEDLFSNNKIEHELLQINQSEKEKFKLGMINTFPQIYLKKKYSNGSLLIGGFDEIKKIHDIVKSSKDINKIKKTIFDKIENISDKSSLRIIELLLKKN